MIEAGRGHAERDWFCLLGRQVLLFVKPLRSPLRFSVVAWAQQPAPTAPACAVCSSRFCRRMGIRRQMHRSIRRQQRRHLLSAPAEGNVWATLSTSPWRQLPLDELVSNSCSRDRARDVCHLSTSTNGCNGQGQVERAAGCVEGITAPGLDLEVPCIETPPLLHKSRETPLSQYTSRGHHCTRPRP